MKRTKQNLIYSDSQGNDYIMLDFKQLKNLKSENKFINHIET